MLSSNIVVASGLLFIASLIHDLPEHFTNSCAGIGSPLIGGSRGRQRKEIGLIVLYFLAQNNDLSAPRVALVCRFSDRKRVLFRNFLSGMFSHTLAVCGTEGVTLDVII